MIHSVEGRQRFVLNTSQNGTLDLQNFVPQHHALIHTSRSGLKRMKESAYTIHHWQKEITYWLGDPESWNHTL